MPDTRTSGESTVIRSEASARLEPPAAAQGSLRMLQQATPAWWRALTGGPAYACDWCRLAAHGNAPQKISLEMLWIGRVITRSTSCPTSATETCDGATRTRLRDRHHRHRAHIRDRPLLPFIPAM